MNPKDIPQDMIEALREREKQRQSPWAEEKLKEYEEKAMKGEIEFRYPGTETVDKPDNVNNVQNVRDNSKVIDPLLEQFAETVLAQQMKVLNAGKYEHPVHPLNHTAKEWIAHQREEMADAMVYQECLKQTIDEAVHTLEIARNSGNLDMAVHLIGIAINRLK